MEMGCEICHFAAPDIIFNHHSKNLFSKVLFKTGLFTGYHAVNRQLLKLAKSFQPDVIWIWKGLEILPQSLEELRKICPVANYNPDHPFIIIARANGNSNVTKSVGGYDLHFCYNTALQKRIEEQFHLPTVFLPFAYDRGDVVYQDPSTITEINRICFQANPDPYRVGIVEMFTARGMEVDVFGNGWQKTRLATNSKVRIFGIAPRAEFWRLNQEYRVQLNLFRAYNVGSHNMRTFEIPAVGGIQLTPYSAEQAQFFSEGEEIFFFRDDREMLHQANMLLSLDADRAAEIRQRARQRSLISPYSFEDRAVTVYNTFQKMKEW